MDKTKTYLGEFEELVLMAIQALHALEGNAYGVPIRKFLEDTTGRSVSYLAEVISGLKSVTLTEAHASAI